MFDNSKPNIILLTDNTNAFTQTKLLGVHKIAYVLREAGYEVAVINHLSIFSIEEIKHILNHLVNDNTLFVGFNPIFYKTIAAKEQSKLFVEPDWGALLPHGKHYNAEIKQLIKQKNPNTKLVLGGPTAADLPIFKIFDYVVIGYAEISALNLANHLCHGDFLEKSYRSINGPTIINDPKAEKYNFELSHMAYKDYDCVLPNEVLYLEVARGCIFNCTFCAFPLNGKKKFDYIRHRDLILKELLDNYNRFRVTRYIFCDDTFNDSVEKCRMIYEISKMLPFQLEYWAFLRLDLLAAHPETMDMLVESGLRSAFFGIETFNQKTAIAIRKGGSREKLMDTIAYMKEKWGDLIHLQGSFIFGLPYEDLDSMHQTVDYLTSEQNKLDTWHVQPLKIRNANFYKNTSVSNGFFSEIDKNFEQYGYREQATKTRTNRSNLPIMIWENDYTTYEEVDDLCSSIMQRESGNYSLFYYLNFELASLGMPLKEVLHIQKNQLDWYKYGKLKMYRATQYKKMFFEKFNIPLVLTNNLTWDQQFIKYKTFSNYLTEMNRNNPVEIVSTEKFLW
jgi:hypothetical protein